jgi:hypothetical protein
MKVKAVKGVSWSTYTLYGVEKTPVVIETDEQKTKDGKPLPKEVIDVFIAQRNWVPVDDDDDTAEIVTR